MKVFKSLKLNTYNQQLFYNKINLSSFNLYKNAILPFSQSNKHQSLNTNIESFTNSNTFTNNTKNIHDLNINNNDWTFSESTMLDHLNVIDPAYEKVKKDKDLALEQRKNNFNIKSNPTQEEIKSEFNRLLKDLKLFSFNNNDVNTSLTDYSIPEEIDYYLNKEKSNENLALTASNLTVTDQDDNYKRRCVLVYLYDKQNVSYWLNKALKNF